MEFLFKVTYGKSFPVRTFVLVTVASVAAFLLDQAFIESAFAIPPDQTTAILSTWNLPQPLKEISDSIVDFAGNFYFTETDQNRIGRFQPSTNLITEWNAPTNSSRPLGLGIDPTTENVYFGESGTNKIGQLVPATNIITDWALPNNSSKPGAVTVDMITGAVYFADSGTNKIGRLLPATGVITEWNLPNSTSEKKLGLTDIKFDPGSGRAYITTGDGDTLVSLDTSTDTFTEWPLSSNTTSISSISLGFEGVVFFADSNQNKIGRFDPVPNTVTEWDLPNATKLASIAFDPTTGAVYFADSGTNKIGRLLPTTGVITEWTIESTPLTLSSSPGGSIYYIDEVGRIGRLG